MNRVTPYLWYPAFLVFGIAAFFALLAAGAPPALAAYLPAILVALSILFLALRVWDRSGFLFPRTTAFPSRSFSRTPQIIICEKSG